MLIGPLAPARAQNLTPDSSAQSAPAAPSPAATPPAAKPRPAARRQARVVRRTESIDQRIAMLHAELKITPAEEPDWQAVAQTMRDNAAAMRKIVADKSGQKDMTAVDDLKTYEQFAQAHVDGLQKLVASFQALYDAMPDPQKKVANQVFMHSHQRGAAQPG
jgi:hypothetical protein